MKKEVKQTVYVKVPVSMKKAIQAVADKEERSVSAVIVRLLRESPTLRRELATA
jgi:hypothetical protein